MADILTSTVRGAAKTATDSTKAVANAMLAQPRALLQFYKAIPVLGSTINNAMKAYGRASQAQSKSINNNTTAITSLNKSLSAYTSQIKGLKTTPAAQKPTEVIAEKVQLAGVVALVAAAIANEKIRGTVMSLAEIGVKGAVKAFAGDKEYQKLERGLTDTFNVFNKAADGVAKGIKEAAGILQPVASVLVKGVQGVGSLFGAETELGQTIVGSAALGVGGKIAAPLLNYFATKRGAKAGVRAGLGGVAGQSLAINASVVYLTATNVVGGQGGVGGPGGPPGKPGTGGKPGQPKPVSRQGKAGLVASLLAGGAAAFGLSGIGGGSQATTGGNGEGGGTGEGLYDANQATQQSSSFGMEAALLSGLGIAGAPWLIDKIANRRLSEVPGVDPIEKIAPTKTTTSAGKTITNYHTQENKALEEKQKLQERIQGETIKRNESILQKAGMMKNVARVAGGGLGVLIEGYGYIQNKDELDQLKKSGKINEETYRKKLSELNKTTAGRAVGGFAGGLAGAAIGSAILPVVGTAIGGIIGTIGGIMFGERLTSTSGGGAPSSSTLTDVLPYGGYKNRNDFEQALGPWAAKAAEQLKAPPEAILAQWGLETAWGRKGAVQGKYNYGNIQGTYRKYVMGVDAGRSRAFIDYDSMDDFVGDFVKQLKRPRYNLGQEQVSADRFFQTLKKGGYAEDPDYVSKLNRIMGGQGSSQASSQASSSSPSNLSSSVKSLSAGGAVIANVDTSTRLGSETDVLLKELSKLVIGRELMGGPAAAQPVQTTPPPQIQHSSMNDHSPIPPPHSHRYPGITNTDRYSSERLAMLLPQTGSAA